MSSQDRFRRVEDFYSSIKSIMRADTSSTYFLVSMDLDNFNFINDLFGYEAGDTLLQKLTESFETNLQEGEFFSRIHADNFIFGLRREYGSAVQRMLDMLDIKDGIETVLPKHYSFVCSGGIAPVEGNKLSLPALLDQAHFARKRAKGSHHHTFLYFDQKMYDELQWKKIITLSMEMALQNNEFEMYLQPKIAIKTNEISGAEALVRWNSPRYGMIYPDRFIPILEQNGFIKQLDFHILEQACAFIRDLLDKGESPTPISVNFSKVHLRSPSFADRLCQTVEGYGISTNYIEVELTENVFVDDFQLLHRVITELKNHGFKVSLDDFGRAYSSLNYLKDLPLDVIKIDKGFLSASTQSENGRIVIEKMVELIKSLHMLSVMEGVEEDDQVRFLEKINCDIGQGYYYAKPMPAGYYQEYLRKGTQKLFEEKDSLLEQTEELLLSKDLRALGKSIDIGLLKGHLTQPPKVEYINETALHYVGYTAREFKDIFHSNLLHLIHPDDMSIVHNIMNELRDNGAPQYFRLRALHKSGAERILQGSATYVPGTEEDGMAICSFRDVTNESERNAVLLAVDQSDDIIFDYLVATDITKFSDKYKKVLGFDPNDPEYHWNQDMRTLVHPDDIPLLEGWIQESHHRHDTIKLELRFHAANGTYLWMRCRSNTIFAEDGGAIRVIGLLTCIEEEKNRLQQLEMRAHYDPLTKLLNRLELQKRASAHMQDHPTSNCAFLMLDLDNFKQINDNLGHYFGDNALQAVAQVLQEVFDENSIIGRLGGDEFAVFLCGFSETAYLDAHISCLLERINCLRFAAPYHISGSVGVSLYPQHGRAYDQLYVLADSALYESKRRGKNRYTFYNEQLNQTIANNQTPLEHDERFLSSYFREDMIFNIFEMLYETKDMTTTIHSLLGLLGKRFNVDRVYVFEHNENGLSTSNTYEWCAEGIAPELDLLQNIPLNDIRAFLSNYDKEGIFCCNDIAALDDYSQEILAMQGITALLHCAIINEGKIAGFVGFDLCGRNREWKDSEIAFLVYISRVFSVFLVKSRMKQDLLDSYENSVEMLENLNGFIYVIDTESKEMLYLNRATKNLGIQVGDLCHKAAFGLDAPCENCPVLRLSDRVPNASSEIYSTQIGKWVNSSASKLTWRGCQHAALVCCTDISQYKP